MNDDMVMTLLRTTTATLAMIPTDRLEKYVREHDESLLRAKDIGPLIDPSAYLRSQADGSLNDALNQLTIVKHLLAARRAVDLRERATGHLK